MKIKIHTAAVIMAVLMIATTCNLFAQQRMTPKELESHNKAWKAFYGGRFQIANKQIKPFAKSESSELRYDSLHLQARVQWINGKTDAAMKLWTQLSKFKKFESVRTRLEIAKALNLHLKGKTKEALPLLRRVADNQSLSWLSNEAALEFAVQAFSIDEGAQAIQVLDKAEQNLKNKNIGMQPAKIAMYQELIAKTRNYKPVGGGKKEFETALLIYERKQYAGAKFAFSRIASKFPDSEYGQQSQLYVGHSLVGLGKYKEAIEEYGNVKKDSPYYGSAYIAIIDVNLEHMYDASQAYMVMSQLAENHKHDEIPKDIINDILARVHSFRLFWSEGEHGRLRGIPYADKIASKKQRDTADRIKRFYGYGFSIKIFSGDMRKIITENKTTFVIALGYAYALAGVTDRAETIFEAVTTGKYGRLDRTQQALAKSGYGLALKDMGKEKEAKQQLLSAYSQYKNGTWHDHTLYALSDLFAGEAKNNQMGDQQTGYLEMMLKYYPNTMYKEAALYELGLLYKEAKSWKQAIEVGDQYLAEFAGSPNAGQVCIDLFNIHLEQYFDLDAAQATLTALDAAEVWLEDKNNKQDTAVRYALHLRQGLVAYMKQQYPKALTAFELAGPLKPASEASENTVLAGYQQRSTIEVMMEMAKAKKLLTPKEVMLGGKQIVKSILQIADVYQKSGDRDYAIKLYTRIIEEEANDTTPTQLSWAHYQRAESIRKMPDALSAKPDYQMAQKVCPTASWSPEAMFISAQISGNNAQDKAQSNKELLAMVKRYPKHERTERAEFFIAINYRYLKQWRDAERHFKSFLVKYPDSVWNEPIKEDYLKQVEENLQ